LLSIRSFCIRLGVCEEAVNASYAVIKAEEAVTSSSGLTTLAANHRVFTSLPVTPSIHAPYDPPNTEI
jgi:hypothetical protein